MSTASPLPYPINQTIHGQSGTPYESRLRTGADVIRNTTIPCLVEGVIHEEGVGIVYAEPETGKTPVVLDLALSISNGIEIWADRYLINRSGPVVYVAMEGGPVVQSYIHAWLLAHPGKNLDNFYILDEDELDLSNPSSWNQLMKDIQTSNIDPIFMVFDTQVDVSGDLDENSAKDMRKLYGFVKEQMAINNCFAMFIHHTGKDGMDFRGSSAIRGKSDVMIKLTKTGYGTGNVVFDKLKGLAKPKPHAFAIDRHPGASIYVHWPDVAGLSITEAAEKGFDQADRDKATDEVILDLLLSPSKSMTRTRQPTEGWSQSEIVHGLKDWQQRADGPVDVHTRSTFVGERLQRLSREGLIINKAKSRKNGAAAQWALVLEDD